MLLVFAHVPPPHHGQSYMVRLMLDGLTRAGIPHCHVDARVSDELVDVGGRSPAKLFRLLGHGLKAIWSRFASEATTLYYIPAPAKTSAVIRDLVALTLLRPFFPRVVLHWHAVGLGQWAGSRQGLFHRLAAFAIRRLLDRADIAIVIAEGNRGDAEVFRPKSLVIIPNGIPDPNPSGDWDEQISRRPKVRSLLGPNHPVESETIRIVSLGHCTATKGFFDLLDALLIARELKATVEWTLEIAGEFLSEDERILAARKIAALREKKVQIETHGFLRGAAKTELFRRADLLVFPSWSESFGLVAVEALAFGVPVIGSDIPGIRAVLDGTGCLLVPPRDPESLARAISNPAAYVDPLPLRKRYEEHFTEERFQDRIATLFAA